MLRANLAILDNAENAKVKVLPRQKYFLGKTCILGKSVS